MAVPQVTWMNSNGHFGVTPDHPNGVYHYHATTDTPYLCGGYKGVADTSQSQGRRASFTKPEAKLLLDTSSN